MCADFTKIIKASKFPNTPRDNPTMENIGSESAGTDFDVFVVLSWSCSLYRRSKNKKPFLVKFLIPDILGNTQNEEQAVNGLLFEVVVI